MSSFFLRLPSIVTDVFNHNKTSNYATRLNEIKRLDGSWEVGLAEILFTKSWYNIQNDQIVAIDDGDGNRYEIPGSRLQAGCFTDHDELIKLINQKIDYLRLSKYIDGEMVTFPNLTYDKISRNVTLAAVGSHGKPIYAVFRTEVTEMLGLEMEYKNRFKLYKRSAARYHDNDVYSNVIQDRYSTGTNKGRGCGITNFRHQCWN